MRIAQGLGGALLLVLFCIWLVVRTWEPMASYISMGERVGWLAWFAAWGCLVGGVSLVASALIGRRPRSPGTRDE